MFDLNEAKPSPGVVTISSPSTGLKVFIVIVLIEIGHTFGVYYIQLCKVYPVKDRCVVYGLLLINFC